MQRRVERIEVIHRGVDADAFDPHSIAPERVARTAPALGRGARAAGHSAGGAADAVEGAGRADRRDGPAADAGRLARRGRRPGRRRSGARRLRQGVAGANRTLGAREQRAPCRVMWRTCAAAYLAAHVTVVASIEPEAFGRTAIEAAALACPVIATNIGAPPETVLAQPIAAKQEITGWLVPPGNAGGAGRLACRGAGTGAGGARGDGRTRAAGTCSPISPPRPCSAVRWPFTTGCSDRPGGPQFNAGYHRHSLTAIRPTTLTSGPSLRFCDSACGSSATARFSGGAGRNAVTQQPKESATYVVQ